MKNCVVPSAEVLRFLQRQTEAVFPSCASRRLAPPCKHPRRHLSTSSRRCAKPQHSLIDDLWPRHREAHQALPPPRFHPPQPSSHPRHASNAAHEGWLNRLNVFHRRKAAVETKAQSSGKSNHTVPWENQTYEDTSAQLFNLSRALSRNPSGADLKLRCTEFDSNGSVTLVAGEFKKSELIAKYGLLPRDLRKIDSSVLPHILVRPSAILINLLHLRVLIQSDRVLVFDAYGSTDSYTQSLFMYDLEGKLRQKADPRNTSNNLPYEFRALEAVLISVTSGLEAEFALVRDPVTHILRELEEDIDREKLRHLLVHSKKLGTFEQKARLVRDAIDDLLNADDDLSAMYLTERRKTMETRPEDDHQEVEMLLESYHKICDEIVEISGNLISNIRNTEEVIRAILDANRNQLMLLDLKFSIGTLGLAGGTLIAGLYGMNLENFIEETNWGFASVTVVCFGLTAIISVYGMRKLRKIQKVRMWGEGLGPDERRARRIGERWNWRNEAMESQAAQAWKMQHNKATSGGGPVLWPGMEGLGMHKLAGSDGINHATSDVKTSSEGLREAEMAKARCESVDSVGGKVGPSLTIHDDLDEMRKRMDGEKPSVKLKGAQQGKGRGRG